MLNHLLVPLLESLDGERCVMNDADKIVGYVMSRDHRMLQIPAELVDRLQNLDRSLCRPVAERKRELDKRIAQEVP